MLDIIICEDNTTQRKNLETIIENEVRSAHIRIALSTNNPNEVIQYVQDSKSQNFIYFLDIDLQSNINGLELSKILRQHDPMGYIVFLTSHAELTLLTFQYKVRAMDFIIKAYTNICLLYTSFSLVHSSKKSNVISTSPCSKVLLI